MTARQLDMWTAEAQEERQMKEVPLRVLFNPVITPVDKAQVVGVDQVHFLLVCIPNIRSLCERVAVVCTVLVALWPEQRLSK